MKVVARLPFVLGFASAMLAPSLASAHVRLVYPPPRYAPMGNDDMNIKTGPCGRANDSRTTDMSRITVLQPGATIMVQFGETIGHPGFYRISFDDDGQDAFVAPTSRAMVQTGPPYMLPVLLDNIPDMGATGANMYTATVTLPNVECERCTLQVIQVMVAANVMSWTATGMDPDIYFTCADIALRRTGGGGGMGGGGSAGVAGSGGPGGSGAGGVAQGGLGGVSGVGGSAIGGVATGGAAPTGGSGGTGVPPTGGAGGTPPAGGAPTGAGAPGSGAPAGGAPALDDPLEAPGCGCRTVPARSSGQAFAAAALGLLGLVVRRRRGSRSAAA